MSPAAPSTGSHRTDTTNSFFGRAAPLPARTAAPRHKGLWSCVRCLVPASEGEMSHLCRRGRRGLGLVQPGPTGGPHRLKIPCIVPMFSPGNVTGIVFQCIVLSELNITYVPFTEENYSLCEKMGSRLLV